MMYVSEAIGLEYSWVQGNVNEDQRERGSFCASARHGAECIFSATSESQPKTWELIKELITTTKKVFKGENPDSNTVE